MGKFCRTPRVGQAQSFFREGTTHAGAYDRDRFDAIALEEANGRKEIEGHCDVIAFVGGTILGKADAERPTPRRSMARTVNPALAMALAC